MANLSSHFQEYNKSVSLSPNERDYLRRSRDTIANKIKLHFINNMGLPAPKFIGQGSFSMGTIVKPISGEYDLDLGVYLQGYSNWIDDWPKPERVSNWLKNALMYHTKLPIMNKSTCIRVRYRPILRNTGLSYHVDLPIYIEYENILGIKYVRIGVNGNKQWNEKSDPVALTNWFNKCCKKSPNDPSQLKRIVKYFKAWKNHNNGQSGKFPNGMILTILAANNFYPSKRDDIAFYETARKIYNYLIWSNYIEKPVEPYNDLGKYLDSSQWKLFHDRLGDLVDDAAEATKSQTCYEDALELWSYHFDIRFIV